MIAPVTHAALGSLIAAAAPSPASDFFSSQLFGVIIGSVLTAALSFLLSLHLNRQQNKRDDRAHQRQLERENEAHKRSIRIEKRGRLRAAYKVLLNAAEEYQSVTHQLNFTIKGETEEMRNKRLNASLIKALEGMNEAMIDIKLEGIGEDVKTIFTEMREAFFHFTSKLSSNAQYPQGPISFSMKEITKHQDTLNEKVKELRTVMKNQLDELER